MLEFAKQLKLSWFSADILLKMFRFFLKHFVLIGMLLFVFSFIGTFVAFMIYHFVVWISLWFGAFVHVSTIQIITTFLHGLILLYLARFVYDLYN